MPLLEPVIVISPIGDFSHQLLTAVGSRINRIYGYRCETAPLLTDLDFSFDPRRNQYHSTSILEKLSARLPPNGLKVVGIAKVDLFIPILTYVFGEAQLGGSACIVSTYRLNERGSFKRGEVDFPGRVAKETIHELGHTFKLKHCQQRGCVMHYARSVDDVDHKSDALCRHCRILMEDEKKRLIGLNRP